jgi:hypothetical protein
MRKKDNLKNIPSSQEELNRLSERHSFGGSFSNFDTYFPPESPKLFNKDKKPPASS